MKPVIRVVNKHHGKTGEYIGRGSPLGNPYSHMKGTKAHYQVKDREEAVEKYRDWLAFQLRIQNSEVINELDRLAQLALERGELNLLCFCHPKACHGDVIKEGLDKAIAKELKA